MKGSEERYKRRSRPSKFHFLLVFSLGFLDPLLTSNLIRVRISVCLYFEIYLRIHRNLDHLSFTGIQ